MTHEQRGPSPECHPETTAHTEIINNTDRTGPASTVQAFFSNASMLDAALCYTARGWPVFPVHTSRDGRCSCGDAECERVGKHPRTSHGVKDATTSEDTIRLWWGAWPDANIGIASSEEERPMGHRADQDRARLPPLDTEHERSELTVREFTRRRGIPYWTFLKVRRRLAGGKARKRVVRSGSRSRRCTPCECRIRSPARRSAHFRPYSSSVGAGTGFC